MRNNSKIGASTKISPSGIQKLLTKAKALSLTWPLPEELDDSQLAMKFYPRADTRPSQRFEMPDWAEIHQALKAKGVTKTLLWEEYTQQYPNRCYSYSQFCDRYKHWLKKQKRSMRQVHKAGEKLFVDYAGQTVPIVCNATGEVRHAQIFVAVMGASNYTFAEATYSQSLSDWIGSHVRGFEFIGGVPDIVVPDNLRSGVSKACRYDPDVNPSYQQLAQHYGTAIVPARPRKPQDKAKAEVGVQIIERWILARLRHQTFFSLAELNHCIRALLLEVNNKPFKQLKGTRQSVFDTLDKPALTPLPRHTYQYTDIKQVKVNIGYHVQYDDHLYSVPHQLVGERLELHVKDNLVEAYFNNQRITSHPRKYHSGMTTRPEHMPVKHEKHHRWSPGRLMNWAKDIGEEVLAWIQMQLQQKQHAEQAYRVCLGLLNLSRSYPAHRLNNACGVANQHNLYRLKHIKEILQSNQDQLPRENQTQGMLLPQDHENIRGPESFH
ncbi:IS21 family transposase [Thalassomonas viridans]|uniref:IS21 family transposase n=1 Tax=Thalassomonas viridans TaxID=137584 RepID=A0AAE9Z935_9GAMM|nr:IS21 family transposase [Thalassomonas viridans]WDE08284.1 IS21 family transposase [Thalassomonas viridans]